MLGSGQRHNISRSACQGDERTHQSERVRQHRHRSNGYLECADLPVDYQSLNEAKMIECRSFEWIEPTVDRRQRFINRFRWKELDIFKSLSEWHLLSFAFPSSSTNCTWRINRSVAKTFIQFQRQVKVLSTYSVLQELAYRQTSSFDCFLVVVDVGWFWNVSWDYRRTWTSFDIAHNRMDEHRHGDVCDGGCCVLTNIDNHTSRMCN